MGNDVLRLRNMAFYAYHGLLPSIEGIVEKSAIRHTYNGGRLLLALEGVGYMLALDGEPFRMDKGEYVPGLVARMLDKLLVQMNDITGLYAALK